MAEIVGDTGSPIAHTRVPQETEFPYNRHSSSLSPGGKCKSDPDGVNRLREPFEQLPETLNPRPIHRHKSTPVPGCPQGTTSVGRRSNLRQSPSLTRGITYLFDPYSSDSDSSSSSDEDDGDKDASVTVPASKETTQKARPRHESIVSKASSRRTATSKRNTRRQSDDEDAYSTFSVANENYKTKGRVSRRDGRLKISLQEFADTAYLARALGSSLGNSLKRQFQGEPGQEEVVSPAREEDKDKGWETQDAGPVPKLNIVIMVIGSRGDVQPFLKIGRILREKYGHRVRIATHPAFREFVEDDSQLEFFSVGGNPSELMAFMVKNPGLIPSVETVRAGEVGRRRAAMSEMFEGMWRACINTTDDEADRENMRMMGDKHPFVADAIIANPPSFAHVHIAERLGIPLHMMFTFPYTPTTQFPHPLANIKKTNVDDSYTNFMSYPLVEMMTWQGLGDLVNRFRVKTLGLEPVSTLWAPGQLYRLKVPYNYMWSPALVKKPEDWGPEIDVSGFVFLDLASSFEPPEDLVKFLDAGEPPVYIGFGSIIVDDPNRFTQLIFDAVKMAGVRALVSKGWGGLGGSDLDVPENIFLLDNTPHDWLFPRVRAVVHHGGAGTTAIGLKCGKPTMIVPFFGDQPFWGSMVAEKKAGAHRCIPYKKLTKEKLAEGIKQCLTEDARRNAQKIAESIAKEGDGAENAVKLFHRHLPQLGEKSMRCSILEDRVAVWHMKGTKLRLSCMAADLLVGSNKLTWNDLRLIRHMDWNDFGGPGEPATGVAAALMSSMSNATLGIGTVPVRMANRVRQRGKHKVKKRRAQKRQQNPNRKEHKHSLNPKTAILSGATPKHKDPPALKKESSSLSQDPTDTLAAELTSEATSGLRETSAALVKAPMDLSLAVAQGFHNAPRLYGDDTVRRPVRISGLRSGLRASREEFLHGVQDGFVGLVTHPRRGAKENGTMGFLLGVGLGVGGLVLKNIAAFVGPPAYLMKGLHMEVRKSKQPTGFVRRARILQGAEERRTMGAEALKEAADRVEKGWAVVTEVMDRERKRVENSWAERWGLRRKRKQWRQTGAAENVRSAEKTMERERRDGSLKSRRGQSAQMSDESQTPPPRDSAVSDETAKGERDGDRYGHTRVHVKETVGKAQERVAVD